MFFSNYVGKYRFDTQKEFELTKKAIEFVLDCIKYEDEPTILFNIFQECRDDGYISIKTIPDKVWKNSLIDSGKFYYHPALQMKPNAPIFDYENNINIVNENFLEIRRQFTMNTLMKYIYSRVNIAKEFIDYKRDLNSIKYMENRYKKLGNVSWIDMVLFLADEAGRTNKKSIISLTDNETEVLENIKTIAEYSKIKGFDRQLFRDKAVYEKYGS